MKKTYDVYFNDKECCCHRGWHETYEYCLDYIKQHNGTDESYFADYKGGIVSIFCNETGCGVYAEDIV